MPITIKKIPAGNRRRGYDSKVREMVPVLIALQEKGYVSAAHIADALRELGVTTSKGTPYAESTVFGMLKRGKAMGLPVTLRSRSEAASAWVRKPRPPRKINAPKAQG